MKVFWAEINWIYFVAIVFYFLFSLWEQNQKKKRLEDLAAQKKERERLQSLESQQPKAEAPYHYSEPSAEELPAPQNHTESREVQSREAEIYEILKQLDPREHRKDDLEDFEVVTEHDHESRSHQQTSSEHAGTATEHQSTRREHPPDLSGRRDYRARSDEEVPGEARGLNAFAEIRKASLLASEISSTQRRSRNAARYSLFKDDPRTTIVKAFVWSEILDRPLASREGTRQGRRGRRF